MSTDGDGGPGRREVAYRLFAAEFDDADREYSESDEERAPNYVITPTGGRVNRVFAVGVLTEVQPTGNDILRARVADPTGTFVVYAGQYQPDAQTFLERADPPAYVAVTGKARTFKPEDAEVVYTSIRPESLNGVDEATRDRWTVSAAEQTLTRVGTMATALAMDERGESLATALRERGVPEGLAAGVPLAIDHYGTTPGYLAAVRELAIQAAALVAGEREAVDGLALAPDEGGDADLAALAASADLGDEVTTAADESGSMATTGERASEESEGADGPDTAAAGSESHAPASEAGETRDESGATDESTVSDTVSGPAGTVETETDADDDIERSEDDVSADDGSGEPEASAEMGEFDGEFDLDDEEREEIKSEFGAEFTSGTEVDEPGAAGIETPEPPAEDGPADRKAGQDAAGVPAPGSVSDRDEASEGDETAQEAAAGADDADLEDAVMDAMRDLEEGDGAERAAVIEHVSDDHGVASDAVEDAIQEALMNGRCYEPDEGRLKPI